MTRRTALLIVVIGTLTATSNSASSSQESEPRTIEVVATRFMFEPSEIEVGEGERIRLAVKSGDGFHGFEIKTFKVSKEIPRGGDPVIIEFTADKPGRFPIVCSAYCGEGHDNMKGVLIVQAREKAQ